MLRTFRSTTFVSEYRRRHLLEIHLTDYFVLSTRHPSAWRFFLFVKSRPYSMRINSSLAIEARGVWQFTSPIAIRTSSAPPSGNVTFDRSHYIIFISTWRPLAAVGERYADIRSRFHRECNSDLSGKDTTAQRVCFSQATRYDINTSGCRRDLARLRRDVATTPCQRPYDEIRPRRRLNATLFTDVTPSHKSRKDSDSPSPGNRKDRRRGWCVGV